MKIFDTFAGFQYLAQAFLPPLKHLAVLQFISRMFRMAINGLKWKAL